jgi:hydrogenase-1 operon protein HyaF
VSDIDFPLPVVGPGSQPAEEDDATLDILQLPDEMATFRMPELPEAEEMAGLQPALARLHKLAELLDRAAGDAAQAPASLDISDLDDDNRALIDQVLGEGEVSMVSTGAKPARIQEAVLAGVWRVCYLDQQGLPVRDFIEVAPVPGVVTQHSFDAAHDQVELDAAQIPEGVLNAPPLFAEINHKTAAYRPGMSAHVINLTLLPQTEADLAFLGEKLGAGTVTILSRGYGNCRIASTATRYVWWVQYFNSQDANILNTLEIGGVPAVAQAAPEDLADSAERLHEILEIYR